MFGILKKKISNFIGKLTKKEEEKPESKEEPSIEEPKPVEKQEVPKLKKVEEPKPIEKKKIKPPKVEIEKPKEIPKPKKIEKSKVEPVKKEKVEKKVEPEKIEKKPEPIPEPKIEIKEKPIEKPPEPKEIEIPELKIEIKKIEVEKAPEKPKEEPKKKGIFDQLKSIVTGKPKEKEKIVEEILDEPVVEEKIEEPVEKPREIIEKKVEPPKEVKKEPKVKLGIFDQVKSVITGEVVIKKEDVSELLEEFELGMLEGDVALEVAEEIKGSLENRLIGKKIKKKELSKEIQKEVEGILLEVMEQKEEIDFVDFVKNNEKPVKIMFLGINGAGKTTTLAKLAYMLQNNGLKVVFAAADTFRAAAIEQLEEHAKRLNVKIIKRPYGSDSTAVVYDAVNYAKAHGIDAVLIDTAGRQDTNVDLINELKKMERVIKPDLKIYIGESIGGNAVVSQVSSFNTEIGLNGVILTKIDCDPKGGTIVSISRTTGLPILYITNGQKYEDIKRFDPQEIIDGLVG